MKNFEKIERRSKSIKTSEERIGKKIRGSKWHKPSRAKSTFKKFRNEDVK